MKNKIQEINDFIQAERAQLLNHKLYHKIQRISDLQKFTEGHVNAVWDFMSLLKALQVKLTCTTIPWFASHSPVTRYLINEIVLAEESDEYIDGTRLSHFEMYIDAMKGLGADIDPIYNLIHNLQAGINIKDALEESNLDQRIIDFLNFTFDTIQAGETHKIASAFTFGREDLIPDMFTSILSSLKEQFPETDLTKIVYYFQRHIDLDGDEHGPLAMKMIIELADNDDRKWKEMAETAKQALHYRIGLWDAIADSL
ncbi:DUF3050 domain-containing protein [Sphingobacterium cellulitidis]|uniref:Heme oxygenase n=1 Tax=Sphingobacterium cellulitidis TaxID=1768011 RepID=A0A8H9KX76_9SPHI|nr:DUF3050 domain-containing protein [Sphingobacterium soli]MBA8988343.1 hypothetical protein [Sphingobacterium soli]GGE32006.1 hypothetical protein GCM10011516_32140 [Sphingobacterium soli]